jgi:predicted CoA-binding protein
MSFSGVNMKAVEASYKVTLRIAKAGKPHTIGESLLLPAAKDMANSVLGEKVAKQLESISLSNDIVSRRTSNMASKIKEHLIEKVKAIKYYFIQLYESMMIASWLIFLHL